MTTTTGEKVEVDVNELTTALSNEISSLRSELDVIRTGRERELRSVGLIPSLSYIFN